MRKRILCGLSVAVLACAISADGAQQPLQEKGQILATAAHRMFDRLERASELGRVISFADSSKP